MKKSIQQRNIFLVHAHSDREIVHKLYARLMKDRVNVWLDAEKLQPGQDWQHEIRKAILKSDIVIVCLSQHFNQQQGFRHEELKIALEKAKWIVDEVFIIPVRLEKCDMPEALCHLHRVDLFETGGYNKLIRALHQQAESRDK